MNGKGFQIGKLFGITIRVDWSWLFIFVLITWNLTNVFGQVHPEWGGGLRWGLALLAAVLFFASVLAHELAHSLVALSQGLPVNNITLFLFGGVSNIQREPSTPKDEFLMAAAGPVTSLVLGAGMLAIASAAIAAAGGITTRDQIISRLTPISTMLVWLGATNLILGVFNLIPGFPLDGGRVLRSILWSITKDQRRATRWAAFVGKGVAWLLIVVGISMAFGLQFPILGTGLINGLWLAFIGWFLNSASTQSYQQAAIQDMLDGIPVSRLMRVDPPTVESDCAISDLVHTNLMEADDLAFPVMDHGQLMGIITLEDIRKVPRQNWETTFVRDAMTPAAQLVSVQPGDDAGKAMETLMQRDVRQLPVLNANHEFLGLLRRRDILRWLQLQSGSRGRPRPTQPI